MLRAVSTRFRLYDARRSQFLPRDPGPSLKVAAFADEGGFHENCFFTTGDFACVSHFRFRPGNGSGPWNHTSPDMGNTASCKGQSQSAKAWERRKLASKSKASEWD